jgi:predicted small secreted protein
MRVPPALCAAGSPRAVEAELSHHQENPMNRILALVLAGALALVAGCNTVQGAGKDIAAGGQAIERAAGGKSGSK